MYKSVHTGPKSQFGGVKKGLLRFEYQTGIADCVTFPAIPPIIKQTTMEKRMATLFWFLVFIKIKSKTKIRNSEWQIAFLSCTNPLSLYPMDSEKDFIQKSELVASGSSKWEAPRILL